MIPFPFPIISCPLGLTLTSLVAALAALTGSTS